MCSTKFIIFASFGLCLLASTVFGQFDGQNGQGFGGQMGGGQGFGGFSGRGGGFGGGRGGGHHHGFGGPFGALTSNLTQEQRQQLKDIMKNDNVTKQQTQDSLRSFFEGIGGDALTRFTEMQTQMESFKAQFSNFTANANLSDAAKTLLTQVQAVKDNMQITRAQEKEQIKALFDGASDEVKQELKSLKHGGGRRGGFGGSMGGFGGQQGGFGGQQGGFGGQQGGFGGQQGGFGGQQGGFGGPRFGGQQGGFGGPRFGGQQGGFGGQQGGFGGWRPQSSTPTVIMA
uniref:SXP/RAL-2 family protein Ani s 5-like cation-binding domain-containing protein n=1 Tax=Panagrolaimus sp. ES5 TaxID=591445 RepID=A0AC34F6H0_9BILA